MFLGLDIDGKGAHFCFTDDGAAFQHGRTTLEDFPALLHSKGVRFVGAEYTGRRAELWMLASMAHGARGYVLHSTDRKAYTTIAGQSVKTDKRDAETIAFLLSLWGDKQHQRVFRASKVLFADAETVRKPWTLRALLNSADKLTDTRRAARQRLTAYQQVGNEHLSDLWELVAGEKYPEIATTRAEDYARAEFPHELEQMKSIPGVGPRIGPYLLGFLLPIDRYQENDPKRGNRLRQNVRKLAGLYPIVMDSGGKQSPRRLSKRGNPRLRGMLYLAADHARRQEGVFKTLYDKQRDRGHNHRKAVIAVAIRLLDIAATMLASGELFRDPNAMPPPEPMPAHLIKQADAARALGISRQAVSDLIRRDKLRAQAWNGKTYVVQKYLDIELDRRAQKEASK